jgi:hypothetical protein
LRVHWTGAKTFSWRLCQEAVMLVVAVLAICLFATAAQAQSQWDHNGSVVSLFAKGTDRQFVYSQPRPALPVSSGTLLFAGKRIGNRYSGSAYVFAAKCGALPYSVSGQVSPDERTVTLSGAAPVVDDYCRITSYRNDILIFDLIAAIPGTLIVAAIPGTLICIHPVFTEETRLVDTLDGSEARTNYVAEAINYLRLEYCRKSNGIIAADQSTNIGHQCYQYSGPFRDERVYWGECVAAE